MTSQFVGLVALLIAGADPNAEIRIESAQLTLIEQAEISASEAGLLTELSVREGATIEEGQLLARIDDRESKILRDRAATELVVAQAAARNDVTVRFAKLAADVAAAELQRTRESNEKFPKSVSQTEVDRLKLLADKAQLEIEQAELNLKQAQLSLQVKQHDLDRASLALERRRLSAPFPGMVVQWKKHRGEWVEPGTPIMRLIRLDRLRAEAFLQAESSSPNLVGRTVRFAMTGQEGPASEYEGELVFVSPEIDPVNGQVRIWAEIENKDGKLRPGHTASLIIQPGK
jgi:multidrug efflux pump subunit AcrA (membrane-fusion protein)